MAEEKLLSITEVGEATGLQSSALRYYERSGLIESSARIGGRRHYSAAVLQRLAVIALLQEVGFTVNEIASLVGDNVNRRDWHPLARAKLQEIDGHLERVKTARDLLTAALECECSALESCDLVSHRRGRHREAVQTLSLRMGPPS